MADYDTWQDRDVYDIDDNKIGTLSGLYVNGDTGELTWATVASGLITTKEHAFPLELASMEGDSIKVALPEGKIKDAPRISDDTPSQEEVDDLYDYYADDLGVAGSQANDEDEVTTTDEAEDITRSEEELVVGKAKRETGRVRLKKYIETEHVTKTVPLSKEKLRVEREPIENGEATDAELSEGDQEIVLSEEEAVVEKRTVPKEKIRLTKDEEVEEQNVEADINKEHVDVDKNDRK